MWSIPPASPKAGTSPDHPRDRPDDLRIRPGDPSVGRTRPGGADSGRATNVGSQLNSRFLNEALSRNSPFIYSNQTDGKLHAFAAPLPAVRAAPGNPGRKTWIRNAASSPHQERRRTRRERSER
ncbi:hypothetical protein FAGKG844_110028 [Frankia sp. AgKG'84/4]